jgi:predicted  nucleic acid-binding Zn-ribbon protein
LPSQKEGDVARSSLAERVGILEDKVKKLDSEVSSLRKDWKVALEKAFREQAELLDQRFAEVNGAIAVLLKDVDGGIAVLRKDVGILRQSVIAIVRKLDAR